MKRLFAVFVFLLLAVLTTTSGYAEDQLMWQIGKADNNYEEFAIAHDYDSYMKTFGKPAVFDPAKDDASKSWPFIQPGPADAWAKQQQHPLTVAFNVGKQPTGICTLTVDLADTHAGGPPVYEISINGKSGRFNLPAGGGDASLTTPASGKEYVLSIPFPADYLKTGQNQITLNVVEGSWLLYDYLSLTNSPDSELPEPSVKKLAVSPTIKFVKEGAKLKQVLELSAEFSPGSPASKASVTVAGKTESFTIEPGLMGTAQRELYVDEITKPSTAKVSVTCDGKTTSAVCEIKPQRHWKVYVQASNHVDIGYTDFQEKVAELHNNNISTALDLCKKYQDFEFNTEAAWVQDNYLTMMPEDKKTEFIKYAKSGRLGCQVIYGNMLTGICSHESFIRDLYYARNMSRKYGIPYDIAMSSDVPTQVWTLPTVLAGAGVKYFSSGLNLTRGGSFNKLFNKPFYWQGPDGAKVLTWFSPGYAYAANLHLFSGVSDAEPHVQKFLDSFNRPDYPYDAVLAFGGQGDNQPLNPGLAPTVNEWNKKYAYPKIILCRGPEFFEYIENGFKSKIPTITGDAGVYWEDGAGSSMSETSMVRLAKDRLATAEKMASLAHLLHGSVYPKAELDDGWKNSILFDEHTWGAAGSISQPESEQTKHQWRVKSGFAMESDSKANYGMVNALEALTIPMKIKEPSIFVFNPTNWIMNDWVLVMDYYGDQYVTYARDVPPLGYKVIPMPKEKAERTNLPPGTGVPVMENTYYRVEFDPATGGVKSLYDKQLKRELVDKVGPYGLNQYVYTLGRTQGERVVDIKDVTREGITEPVVFSAQVYGLGRVMSVRGQAKNTQWASYVTLFDREKRIDFINILNKNETTDKEAGYFAFPFALNKPQWYIELPNGVVSPNKNMLPGADMSWYCTQDYVAADDGNGAVLWTSVDSPLLTLCDINRDTFQSPLPLNNGHLYSYAFNNYWFTNYKASQGGGMTFRYSMTSMPKYDPVAASRFGQKARNPLFTQILDPSNAGTAPLSASICSVSAPNVNVQAVKLAESGKGLVIRLRELAGTKTQLTLTMSAGKFNEAWSCNLVEDPQKKLTFANRKVTVVVPAKGMATVLVR